MIKNNLFLVSFLILTIFFTSICYANPYGQKKSEKQTSSIEYPDFINKTLFFFTKIQKEFSKLISGYFKSLKTSPSLSSFFYIILFSFLYGIFHSMGPGHGKIFLTSYITGKNISLKNSVITASFMGFLHGISAVTMILILNFFLRSSLFANFNNTSEIIKKITAFLIIFIVLYNIFKIFFNKKDNKSTEKSNSMKDNIIFASAVGLAPCPIVAIIMLFSINMQIIHYGLLSAIFISAGQAVGISIIAILTYFSKTKIVLNDFYKKNYITHARKVLQVAGFSLILIIALSMLL